MFLVVPSVNAALVLKHLIYDYLNLNFISGVKKMFHVTQTCYCY